jgi:hypothetical protein
MDLDQLAKRYDFENDMLNWLNILDVPAVDVNVPAVYGEETSTMSLWRDGWKIFARLNTGFWRRMWRKYVLWSFSPVALFLIVGMLLLLFALVATILAIPLHSPTQPLPTATVLLAVIPGMTGFYLLVQALMLDIQATPKPQLFTSHIHHHHHHASPAVESEPSEE